MEDKELTEQELALMQAEYWDEYWEDYLIQQAENAGY